MREQSEDLLTESLLECSSRSCASSLFDAVVGRKGWRLEGSGGGLS